MNGLRRGAGQRGARIVLALVLAGMTTMMAGLVLSATPAAAADYAAEGTVDGSTPGLSFTEGSFLLSCPDIPPSQGFDAFVFELPSVFGGEQATATTVSSDGPGEPDLDMVFYNSSCGETGRAETAAAVETAKLPAATKFVLAIVFAGDLPITNTKICLTVGSGRCGGSTSASASRTASASTSASASAGGTTSPSATPSSATPTGSSTSPTPTRSASSSPSTPSTISTTIESSRSTTGYKKKFTLSGRVNFGAGCQRPFRVTVRKRVAGKKKSTVLSSNISVEKNQTWTFSTRSKVSATYSATAEDSTANCQSGGPASVSVAVKVKIKLRVPSACVAPQGVKGKILPKHARSRVLLKRGKKTVDKARVNKKSRFKVTAPSCEGTYKVQWPKKGPRNAKASKKLRF